MIEESLNVEKKGKSKILLFIIVLVIFGFSGVTLKQLIPRRLSKWDTNEELITLVGRFSSIVEGVNHLYQETYDDPARLEHNPHLLARFSTGMDNYKRAYEDLFCEFEALEARAHPDFEDYIRHMKIALNYNIRACEHGEVLSMEKFEDYTNLAIFEIEKAMLSYPS